MALQLKFKETKNGIKLPTEKVEVKRYNFNTTLMEDEYMSWNLLSLWSP